MKKTLTEPEFKKAIAGLDIGEQTKLIAYGVLVEQRQQAEFVELYNLSKGAVSQAVKRVWDSHQDKNVPKGYEVVTALLPEHQAYQVKVWAARVKKLLGAR